MIQIERLGGPGRDIRRLRLHTREEAGSPLLTAARERGEPFATVEARPFRAPSRAPFNERDLVSMILTEMHRHRPNRVLGAAARFAAEISLPGEEAT